MITVWKFEFNISDVVVIEMPEGAEILLVENQGVAQTPCMWARVNTDNERVKRRFYITGTGRSVPTKDVKHVASFQDRVFVWHVWEDK